MPSKISSLTDLIYFDLYSTNVKEKEDYITNGEINESTDYDTHWYIDVNNYSINLGLKINYFDTFMNITSNLG